MIRPVISITYADHRRDFLPGETLQGVGRVHGLHQDRIRAVEISILWRTEGKGSEDIGVHFFERWRFKPEEQPDVNAGYPFETTLPSSPLSYYGQLIKVVWCTRMRVFLESGKELVEEKPFRLGPQFQQSPRLPELVGA